MVEISLARGDVVLRGTATGNGPTVLLLHAGGEERSVWRPIAAALSQPRRVRSTSVRGGSLSRRSDGGWRAGDRSVVDRSVGDRDRSRGTWRVGARSLGDRGGAVVRCELRTVAYDLRGHGDSSGEATTLQAIAEDVNAMVHQEPPPVFVVGASLGGLAAIASLADRHTAQAVAGLILIDVVPNPDPVRVRAWLDNRGIRDHHTALVEDILDRTPDLVATTAKLKLPILLVRGGPDSPLTDPEVERFRTLNPAATVTRIPDAGHLVARDAPTKLARIIADQATIWLAQ